MHQLNRAQAATAAAASGATR